MYNHLGYTLVILIVITLFCVGYDIYTDIVGNNVECMTIYNDYTKQNMDVCFQTKVPTHKGF